MCIIKIKNRTPTGTVYTIDITLVSIIGNKGVQADKLSPSPASLLTYIFTLIEQSGIHVPKNIFCVIIIKNF